MSRNSGRRPSALKHGAFSQVDVFPWESQEEFDTLYRELRKEWQPEGALEEDAVATILSCIWRKRRIRERRRLETTAALNREDLKILTQMPRPLFDTKQEKSVDFFKNRRERDNRARDKVSQLLGLSSSLYGQLDGQFLKLQISMSGREIAEHLNAAVPRENFASAPEWVAAVKREIDEVMLPRARAELQRPDHLAAKAAEFMTPERILADIELEERFDAMIDRATRRLAQTKMMKQISAQNHNRTLDRLPQPRTADPVKPKAITANENAPSKPNTKSTSRIARK